MARCRLQILQVQNQVGALGAGHADTRECGDTYGKVVDIATETGGPAVRIRITSVDAADQNLIDTLLGR